MIAHLNHPLINVPAVATVTNFWFDENGRLIGFYLLFPDGYHCPLTFDEFDQLSGIAQKEVYYV